MTTRHFSALLAAIDKWPSKPVTAEYFEWVAASSSFGGDQYLLRRAGDSMHRRRPGKVRYAVVVGNAYLGDKLEPRLVKRNMPCGTELVVTEPLAPGVARALSLQSNCVEDCNFLLDYYRR